jgi:6,7-dimethyl-8-ribityllumazine synthase
VLTCDTDAQALDRAGLEGSSEDKGWEATAAALDTARVVHAIRG